jgi:hypothetical protein
MLPSVGIAPQNQPTLFYRRCCSATQEAIYELFLSPKMEVHRQLWSTAGIRRDPCWLHAQRPHGVYCYNATRLLQNWGCGRWRWRARNDHPRDVFAQVRVFPPPPPAVSPIAGLMDTHVHTAPDVFGRALDDEEAAILYRDRGLEALVLKNHVLPTADRAWF